MLQRDVARAGLLCPESERYGAAGADRASGIIRLRSDRLDNFVVKAIDRPAVARGRILRQSDVKRFADAKVDRLVIVGFGQRRHGIGLLRAGRACAGDVQQACAHQRGNASEEKKVPSGHGFARLYRFRASRRSSH